MGSVVLFSSDKSCIGKTIIGIKTGIELSNRGKRVLVIDLANGNKKIAEYFKVDEDIIYDIKDVFDGTCSMEQAVINISDNLCIIPYPRVLNKIDNIKKDSFSRLITEAKDKYDILIIDVNGLSSSYYLDFTKIEKIIVINNNDFSAVKEINNASDIAKKFELQESFIINRYNKKNASKGTMLKIKDMNKMLDKEIMSVIEEENKYGDADYNFIFNKDTNSFNSAIDSIANKLSFID
ncbi:septum site-determining protein MinD [Sedimentibacter acidaminivorans]|uniref:Septum site-determining protein MinD n=1 Tax=Sedimentibacter acidaminivorans TaxID=913099 RepID=A0ABS4GB93_9FIRM|nr:AAA family ATPase [Sedimentibacter acidaminivorans]MBP1924939.1 septum site-determining protein MinD [Sedimentibacter acidaminivorans]